MKWFNILKSRAGKLTLNTQSAVVLALGVGVLTVSVVHNIASSVPTKNELTARSLSSISNEYNYGGLRQTKEGLSSMNMANLSGGLDGIASAEERARIEAGRTGNGQFGLDAADNMGRNVSSAMSGPAAEMSDTEGLGMGKNAVVMQNNASGSSTANMPQVAPGTVAQQGQNARNARGATNQLAPASARTSGGSGVSNSGFGGSSSSGANRSVSSSYSGSSARGEGYRLSGTMPGGTNPVSMRGEGGRNSSGFGAGRNASVGQSGRFKSTGNDLRDISRQSAKIAANAHRSSNSGIEPFLAKNTTTNGLDMKGVEGDTSSSPSFKTATIPSKGNRKSYDNGDPIVDTGNLEDREAQRSQDRDDLVKKILLLLAATPAVLWAATKILDAADKLIKKGGWFAVAGVALYVVGYALLAALFSQALNLVWKTSQFVKDYGSTIDFKDWKDWSLIGFGYLASTAVTAAVVLAAIPKTRETVIKKFGNKTKELGGKFLNEFGKTAIGVGIKQGGQWLLGQLHK